MDFLMFMPDGAWIVLEANGRTHYAVEKETAPDQKLWIADPFTYARTTAGSRKLTLSSYEVYRLGGT
jgi:hypothetical protein